LCREFDVARFLLQGYAAIGHSTGCPSLVECPGNWLQSPESTPKQLRGDSARALHEWVSKVRLHLGIQHASARAFRNACGGGWADPGCSSDPLTTSEHLSNWNEFLLPDDKDAAKMWPCSCGDLYGFLLNQKLVSSGQWKVAVGLTVASLASKARELCNRPGG